MRGGGTAKTQLLEGQRVGPGKALGINAFSKLWFESLTETSQEQGLGGKSVLGRGNHRKYVLKKDGKI